MEGVLISPPYISSFPFMQLSNPRTAGARTAALQYNRQLLEER